MKKTLSDNVTAIILAAGKGTRLNSIIDGHFKPLIKVNGCPAIILVAKSIIQQGVMDFVIVANSNNKSAIEDVWNNAFHNLDLNLKIVVQTEPLGPAHALSFGMSVANSQKHILVCLADTLFDEIIPLSFDWVGTAKATGSGKWCWVQHINQKVIDFYDKVEPPQDVKDVLMGLYYFRDSKYLKECIDSVITNNIRLAEGEYQLSNVINLYKQKYPIKAKEITTWTDVGSIENYLNAQEKLIQHRNINSFFINRSDTQKTIEKKGPLEKINNEINWIKKVNNIYPEGVLKIIDTTKDSYKMEYCRYPLLSKIYLYENTDPEVFCKIIKNLLTKINKELWLNVNDKEKIDISKECKVMYFDKPLLRLEEWHEWENIRKIHTFNLNGNQITNIELIIKNITQYLKDNHKPVLGIIHGDFHFGNIFFDETEKIFKLIDPRGSFGSHKGIIGDVYYELAKLRHSYHGMYDAILDGLYTVEINDQGYNLKIGPQRLQYIEAIDNLISELGYDLNIVKTIEFTILLSLISIHSDSRNNQIAFFLQAMLLSKDIII